MSKSNNSPQDKKNGSYSNSSSNKSNMPDFSDKKGNMPDFSNKKNNSGSGN